jgi:pyridoxal phosphate enzyme (YggS family)
MGSLGPAALQALRDNLDAVRRRIADAAETSRRSPEDVTLVVVTKAAPLAAVRALADLGVRDIGENRVQQGRSRHARLGAAFRWHLIGHLQRNKVKAALEFADLVHSVDSLRLLDAIDRRSEGREVPTEVLLEVNVSGEASKHGFTPAGARAALGHASNLPNLRTVGLMTMAPIAEDEEEVRDIFRSLRQLRDDLNRDGVGALRHLSMGMTQDYRVAVEEGATLVRVGSAIFRGVEADIVEEG